MIISADDSQEFLLNLSLSPLLATTGNDDNSAQIKAKARRAQVRKAQKQHRERKANYTKELEQDVARLRDLIEQTQTEGRALKLENDAMRRDMSARAPNLSLPEPVTTTFDFALPTAPVPSAYGAVPPPPPPPPPDPEYTVRVEMSELMQTPAFQVTRSPTARSGSQAMDNAESISNGTDILRLGASPETLVGDLTEAQTDLVINFILAYVLAFDTTSPICP